MNYCTICNKPCEYRSRYWKFDDTPDGLKEVELITYHPNCKMKLNRLREKLLDIEWKIYQLKYGTSN